MTGAEGQKGAAPQAQTGSGKEAVAPTGGQRGELAVQEARSWIGTPYLHQASCKGAGCDCLGLIRGLWRRLYGQEPERPPGYSMDWSEAGGSELLWQAAARHLRPRQSGSPRLGDVLLFRMRPGAVAKHLGVQSALAGGPECGPGCGPGCGPRFIHAYSAGGVVESALTPAWQRRIVARFSFPEELN